MRRTKKIILVALKYQVPFTFRPDAVLTPDFVGYKLGYTAGMFGSSHHFTDRLLQPDQDLPKYDYLDLGCGSGIFGSGLEMAERFGDVIKLTNVDISEKALQISRVNHATTLEICRSAIPEHHAIPMEYLQADWQEEDFLGSKRFDVIYWNPPFKPDGEKMRIKAPGIAVYAGIDGLDAYRSLIPRLHSLIKPGGTVYIRVPNNPSKVLDIVALVYKHQNQYLKWNPWDTDTKTWPLQIHRHECYYIRTVQNLTLSPVIIKYKWWHHVRRMPLTYGRVLALTYPKA